MIMPQSRRNLSLLRLSLLALGLVLAAAFASPGRAAVHATVYQEQTLHSFCSQPNCADGVMPNAGLIRDGNGNLYGTASRGGANNNAGTVFRLNPNGTGYTVLYSFCSLANCADGATPLGGLIIDGNGNLYGTTSDGGALGCSPYGLTGCGTVYRVKTDGSGYTVLYTFAGYPDASSPSASLVMDNAGNLYGTASSGGALNVGAVFQLAPNSMSPPVYTYSLLYSFCSQTNCADGAYPLDFAGSLVMDGGGNLYGTAANGGGANAGTAFKLTAGTLTVLYTFCSQTSCTDGATPFAGLILDGSGNLYGTTILGGANDFGTAFRLPSTTATTGSPVLYSFCSQINCSDGSSPAAGLTIDSSGNLYGTTTSGGAIAGSGSTPSGTLFQLTSRGTTTPWPEAVLYTFTGGADGAQPVAAVGRDAATGIFYGTAPYGGIASASAPSGDGTVFTIGPASAVVLTPGAPCNGVFTGTFKGNITVSAGQSCVYTNPCEIKGNVTVNSGGTFQMLGLGCILDGNLTENSGKLVTLGKLSAVGGNVVISGASGFNLSASGIGGSLQINQLSGGSPDTVCAMAILRNVQLKNNSSAIVVGAQGCAGSAIGGELEAAYNSAALSIDSNLVGDDLEANNNTAAIDVSANKIGGDLQCQKNAAVTDTAGTNYAHGKIQGQCVGKHF
jgi:uncharacterized repeat protein (TIGR03803 family)